MPDAEKRRHRRAYHRGVLRTGAVMGIILVVVSVLGLFAWKQTIEGGRPTKIYASKGIRPRQRSSMRKANDELLAQQKEKELRQGEILRRVAAKPK